MSLSREVSGSGGYVNEELEEQILPDTAKQKYKRYQSGKSRKIRDYQEKTSKK